MRKPYPETLDGRYFVAKNRLWRKTDPRLDADTKQRWVCELMSARRAVKAAGDDDSAQRIARDRVQAAKEALGERGPVWWDDGAPDETGTHPQNSSYAAWWASGS